MLNYSHMTLLLVSGIQLFSILVFCVKSSLFCSSDQMSQEGNYRQYGFRKTFIHEKEGQLECIALLYTVMENLEMLKRFLMGQ